MPGRVSVPYGDIISVESIVSNGDVSHVGVTGRLPTALPFRSVGQFRPSQLKPEEEEVSCTLAGNAIRALGVISGIVHAELKLTPLGPRVIEVNGRLGDIRLIYIEEPQALTWPRSQAAWRWVSVRSSRSADKVCFQLYLPAPVIPCTLIEVRGLMMLQTCQA